MNVLWRDGVIKFSAVCRKLRVNRLALNPARKRFCVDDAESWLKSNNFLHCVLSTLQKRHIQIIKYNGYRQHSLLNESSTDNRDYKPKATAMAVLLISERITRESVMHMEREGGWH